MEAAAAAAGPRLKQFDLHLMHLLVWELAGLVGEVLEQTMWMDLGFESFFQETFRESEQATVLA